MKRSAGDQHYRDYVVRAFNADKPYDRFLTEQLAGDLLPPANDRQAYLDQITAPAFLSIGAWFDMETDPNRLRLEMIDEMINTTSRAFCGLSVACARCHDHPFDPIPAADYYSLGGIFGSTKLVGDFSESWRDGRIRQLLPLAMPDEVAANDRIRDQINARRKIAWDTLGGLHAQKMAEWQADEAGYRAAAARVAAPFVKRFEAEDFGGQTGLRIAELSRDGKVVQVIETLLPKAQWVKYAPEVPRTGQYRLDALYSSDESAPVMLTVNGTVVAKQALAAPTGGGDLKYQQWATVGAFELREGMNFIRLDVKEGSFPRLDKFRLIEVDPAVEKRIAEIAASEHLHPKLLADFVVDPADPWPRVAEIVGYLGDSARTRIVESAAECERMAGTITPYDMAISVTEQPKPSDLPVHPRGVTSRESDEVPPRGMPRLLDRALPRPGIPATHSGRLELAGWLTDPRHPLTSRVIANRIWHWHFGRGIVATTSDFGSRGAAPSNPALLDWLAATLVERRWSIKDLHRLILTSGTYRMSSQGDASPADPDNILLSRFPRRRLDADELFDSLFSTRNIMPRQPSGQPLDVDKSKGRALYVLTSGRSPEGLGVEVRKMFTLFDYDSSGQPVAERPTSQTPAQALFWLNSPLVKYYADKFAERLLKMDRLDDGKRIDIASVIAFGHPASDRTRRQSLAYITARIEAGVTREQAWAKFCQALFGTNEFRYVD